MQRLISSLVVVLTAVACPAGGPVIAPPLGNEGEGAPAWLHEEIGPVQRIRIPQFQEGLRSLNLSTAAGIATYEALRQLRGPAPAVPLSGS